MPIPTPTPNETENDFIERCMSDEKMKSEYPDEPQRYAVCVTQFAPERVSFDWDGTGSTAKGKELIQSFIDKGADVYIITARSSASGIKFEGIATPSALFWRYITPLLSLIRMSSTNIPIYAE